MTPSEQQSFLRWLKGIPYEIKFWNSYYTHPKSLKALYSWSDYGQKCRLDNFDIQGFLSRSGERPLMVDVGCALSYVLGTEFDNPGAQLHLVDPLASFYNRILDKTHNSRQRLREGMIELLSTIYEPGSVDIVHVRNALDHCANPMLGVFEGLQVLRTGGVLYLHHHINEAERESYNGFHQYNIECRNGRLVIWNRTDCIDVAEELAGFADVECSVYKDKYVVAVITKLKDTPTGKYNPKEAPRRATEMMDLTVSALTSPGFTFSFHTRMLLAGIAHPVMRRIPRAAVERLKTLRRSIVTIALLLFTLPALRAANPVFEGWYADPEGVVFGDTYWIYPTWSDVYERQTFIDCFSSGDLVNWERHHAIIDTAEVKWARKCMWAPAVVENKSKYYLFFSANDVHEGEIGGIGVAVADRPEGPFRDILGKPLINDIVNGAQPIDQFVFKDDDGEWYMYYGGWGHCNIVRLNDDLTGLIPWEDGTLYREVTPQGYTEGPFMLKRDGKYYFMWSEGGWGAPDYSVAYSISDNPHGPFVRIGKILSSDPEVATSAGHHSVIRIPGQDEYYIIYHRRPLGDDGRDHRHTCIDRLTFNPDGTIAPVKITRDGVPPRPIRK